MAIISFAIEKEVEYVECGIMTTDQPWRHLPRISGLWVLALCTQGTLYMNIEDTEYTIRPGDVFILPVKKLHFGTRMSPGGISYYWMHFYAPDLETVLMQEEVDALHFPPERSYLAYHASMLDINTVSILFNQLYDNNYSQHYSPNLQKNLMKVLLYEISNQTLLRQARRFDQHFMQLLDYLRSNFTGTLVLDDLAERFNYNKHYLCRIFKMRTGKTLVTYQMDLRICYACQLLNETNHPVKVVAKETGFESEKYFMRVFKEKIHITPTQFRNAHRIMILDQDAFKGQEQ